ncbi:twin-arginine translocation signal domain-containing protein, partial [bacterium]|nr:twin-arginine translocation signal domain-containing protein [bacterium]
MFSETHPDIPLMNNKHLSRRQFIQGSACALGGVLL